MALSYVLLPRIVRDNGSQFVSKEWREVICHFDLEETFIFEWLGTETILEDDLVELGNSSR